MQIFRISNTQSKIKFDSVDWDINVASKVMEYIKGNKCGKYYPPGKAWFVDNQHILPIKGIEDDILTRGKQEEEEGLFGEEEFMRQFDD